MKSLVNRMSRQKKFLLMAGLISCSSFGLSPAFSYEIGSDQSAGNQRTMQNIVLEESESHPKITIGEMTFIGLKDGDEEGFVTADEIKISDLEVDGKAGKLAITFKLPSLKYENYEGPAFTTDQLESGELLHPAVNWLSLLFQINYTALTSSPATFEVQGENGGRSIDVKGKAGASSIIISGDQVKGNWDEQTYAIKLGREGDQTEGELRFGGGSYVTNLANFNMIASIITPEKYENAKAYLVESFDFEGLDVAMKNEGSDPGHFDLTLKSVQMTNYRLPGLSLELRKAIHQVVGLLARGEIEADVLFQGLDVAALTQELLTTLYQEAITESFTTGEASADFQVEDGKFSTKFDSIEVQNVQGVRLGSMSLKGAEFYISPPNENESVNASFAELSVENQDLSAFYRNFYIPLYVELAKSFAENGAGHAKTEDEIAVEIALKLSLDEIYPKLGNWRLEQLEIAVPEEKIEISLASFHTKQADNEGMPDSGEVTLNNLVLPAELFIEDLGPAASLIANEDGKIDASVKFAWAAESETGGYKIKTLSLDLDQGGAVDLSIDLGGLPENWQSIPFSEFDLVQIQDAVGFSKVGLKLVNQGLVDRGLDFLPLMTGMSAEEAKKMAKTNLGQVLQLFVGSPEYSNPLKEAINSFIDKPGTLELTITTKSGEVIPLQTLQTQITFEGTSPEELFDYEASASN